MAVNTVKRMQQEQLKRTLYCYMRVLWNHIGFSMLRKKSALRHLGMLQPVSANTTEGLYCSQWKLRLAQHANPAALLAKAGLLLQVRGTNLLVEQLLCSNSQGHLVFVIYLQVVLHTLSSLPTMHISLFRASAAA